MVKRTALNAGLVKIQRDQLSRPVTLLHGTQLVLINEGVSIRAADSELTIAWQNGNFIFNSGHPDDIMRRVSGWYNVVYNHNDLKSPPLSGSSSHFESAAQVPAIFRVTGMVQFKLEERRIIVM